MRDPPRLGVATAFSFGAAEPRRDVQLDASDRDMRRRLRMMIVSGSSGRPFCCRA